MDLHGPARTRTDPSRSHPCTQTGLSLIVAVTMCWLYTVLVMCWCLKGQDWLSMPFLSEVDLAIQSKGTLLMKMVGDFDI